MVRGPGTLLLISLNVFAFAQMVSAMPIEWSPELKSALKSWVGEVQPGSAFQRSEIETESILNQKTSHDLLAFIKERFGDDRPILGRDLRLLLVAVCALREDDSREVPIAIQAALVRGLYRRTLSAEGWPKLPDSYYQRMWRIVFSELERQQSVFSDSQLLLDFVLKDPSTLLYQSLQAFDFSHDFVWMYDEIEKRVEATGSYRPRELEATAWWKILMFRTANENGRSSFAAEKVAQEIVKRLGETTASVALTEMRLDIGSKLTHSERFRSMAETFLSNEDPDIRLSALWALKKVLGFESSWWQLKAFDSIRHAEHELASIYAKREEEDSENRMIKEAGIIRLIYKELIRSQVKLNTLLQRKTISELINYDISISNDMWGWLASSARGDSDPFVIAAFKTFSQLAVPTRQQGQTTDELREVFRFSSVLQKVFEHYYLDRQINDREISLGLYRQLSDPRVLGSEQVNEALFAKFEAELIEKGWVQARLSDSECGKVLEFRR